MLGKYVRVRVERPMGWHDVETGTVYRLNYGSVESGLDPRSPVKGAYIMGVTHPVRNFEGTFMYQDGEYTIDCLYERSCGAVVFRFINGERRFLLIKNKRSCHWGFPKGHVEKDETDEETAKREVLEETGIHIKIFPGFKHKSEYTIRGRIEKSVLIFLATTDDIQTVIQPEEIEDYIWLGYDNAISTLNYPNDKDILSLAKAYITKNNI